MWFESEAAEDFLRGLNFFRQDVKEDASAFGAEDESTTVGVEFDGEVDTGLIEGFLDRQRFAQLFGDVNEIEFGLAEEFRLLTHGARTGGR